MAEIKLVSPLSVEYVPIPEGQIPGIDSQQIDPVTSIEGWAELLNPPAEEENFEVPTNEFKKKYTAGENISDLYASVLWQEKAYISSGQLAQSISGGNNSVDESFDKTSKKIVETYVAGGQLFCKVGELNEAGTAFAYGATSAPITVQQVTAAACIDESNSKVFVFYGLIDSFNGDLQVWGETGTIDSSNNITWDGNVFGVNSTNQSGFTINEALYVPENNTVFLTYALWNNGFLSSFKIVEGIINKATAGISSSLNSIHGMGFDSKNSKIFVNYFSYNSQDSAIRSYTVNSLSTVLTASYSFSYPNCTGFTAACFNPKDGYVYFRYRYNYNVASQWAVFRVFDLSNGAIISYVTDTASYLQNSKIIFVDQIADKILFASDTSGVLSFKIRNSTIEFEQDSSSNYSAYRKFDFEGRNILLKPLAYLKYKAESRERVAGVIQTGGLKDALVALILLGGENTKFTGLSIGDFIYIQSSGLCTTTETDYPIGIATAETKALINKSV